MLEHPAFRPQVIVSLLVFVSNRKLTAPQLFIAGNVPTAGQEERFPGPDNVSKMRRSIENAEHVGLYVPSLKPALHPSSSSPTAPKPRRRRLRRNGNLNGSELRPTGVYLPPARASHPASETSSELSETPSPATRRLVDIHSPYDPFAGTPSPFS